MAKLFDKLMNRVIKGKLIVEESDELGDVVKIETSSDISELSDEVLDSLKVGDVVQKITGNMKHCYIVTYKEEHKGVCLSYFDCGYLETISYDYTAGHWVFNSKDVCEVQEKITSNTDLIVKTLEQEQANKTFTIDTSGLNTGITLSSTSYLSAKVINGILWLVIEGTFQNSTESSIAIGTLSVDVDEEVGSRIYLKNGETINTYTGDEHKVTDSLVSIDGSIVSVALTCYFKNRMQFYFYTSIASQGTKNVSLRIPIILL